MRIKDVINSFFKYIVISVLGAVFSIYIIKDKASFLQNEDNRLYIYLIFILVAFILFMIENIYFYVRNKSYQKKYDYYREFPNDYSPSVVSLLLNLKVEYKKDILADLIFLEQKRIIKIDEDQNIIIIDDNYEWKDYEEHLNLIMTEIVKMNNPTVSKFLDMKQYQKTNKILDFLHHVLSSKEEYVMYGSSTKLTFPVRYIDSVHASAYKKGLLTKYSIINFLNIFLNISVILLIMLLAVFSFFKINVTNIKDIWYMVALIIILGLIVHLYRKFNGMDNSRSKKGKNEVALWHSFISFIKDFSRLDTRNLEEKNLWGYYFAYGLSLGVNKKVMKKFGLEYEKYIIK